MALALAALAALSGCGDDDGPSEIVYPAPGSLIADSGRGSFRFGAASAATQIEDQNEHTDWYAFTLPVEQGGLGKGTFVGEASQGYSRALADVQLIADTHLDSYRFSIEWARVEPQRDVLDEDALAHYSDELDALLAAGIQPMITVHHFSNPIWIDDPRDLGCAAGPGDTNLCGLGDPVGGPLVVEEMAEFAQLLAERFGDRVDEWGTLNEPVNYLLASQGVGYFPPGKSKLFDLLDEFAPVVRDYLAAHAAMYHAIAATDTIDADGDGVAAAIGLTLSVAAWTASNAGLPSDDPLDVSARDRVVYLFHHLVADSVRDGTFDADLDGVPDEDHPEWADTLDWLGVQYYFRAGVSGHRALVPVLALTPCFGDFDLGSCLEPIDITYCVPQMGYEYWAAGLYDVLADYGARYPDLPLIVSESGIATTVGERRAENVVRALEQIERARAASIDVRGYYHWSLFDNFEWAEGFTPRFGLYTVDYVTFERTPTLGATVLAEIAGGRRLSSELRLRHGGDGPMTPEPSALPDARYCY